MKGAIFTEFLDMVEERFSPELVERILDQTTLPSGGSYTALGSYSHHEILSLFNQLAQMTGAEAETLQQAFGEYLFNKFAVLHKPFMEGASSSLDFLEKVESYIHVEVKKLYPQASPPQLTCTRIDKNRLEMGLGLQNCFYVRKLS